MISFPHIQHKLKLNISQWYGRTLMFKYFAFCICFVLKLLTMRSRVYSCCWYETKWNYYVGNYANMNPLDRLNFCVICFSGSPPNTKWMFCWYNLEPVENRKTQQQQQQNSIKNTSFTWTICWLKSSPFSLRRINRILMKTSCDFLTPLMMFRDVKWSWCAENSDPTLLNIEHNIAIEFDGISKKPGVFLVDTEKG